MLKSLLLIAAFIGDPSVWPTFLGQGASKIDAQSIPVSWSPTENIAWKTKLPGKGQSSPVIWGDKVFVTCIEGTMKDTCYIVAISLADGQELWRQSIASAQPVRSTYTQSRSAPTPAVDANGVYTFFETGNVVACGHDGQIKWQRDLTADYGMFESTIGLAASPTVYQDTMIILVDHEGPSYLLGLDTASGQEKWKTERISRSSYSSPILHTIAGKTQIICSSSGSIDGYDPANGEMLWTFDENIGGNRTGAALPISEGIFTISGTPGMHNEREQEARNTNLAMQIELIDGQYVPKVLWRTTEAMPAYNSPMSHRNLSYWVTKAGIVYCYDASSGKQVYANRACSTCWATPVGLDDRIYLFGKDGTTVVIAAGPEFKVLSENTLWNPDEVGRDSRPGGGSMSGMSGRMGRSGRGAAGADHSNHGTEQSVDKPADSAQPEPSRRTGRPQVTSDVAGTEASATGTASTEKPATESSASQTAESGANASSKPETVPANDTRTDGSRSGDSRFAAPVQYGVAMVSGSLVIRTGEVVYCVRKQN